MAGAGVNSSEPELGRFLWERSRWERCRWETLRWESSRSGGRCAASPVPLRASWAGHPNLRVSDERRHLARQQGEKAAPGCIQPGLDDQKLGMLGVLRLEGEESDPIWARTGSDWATALRHASSIFQI
jgi:hypothetical protein